MDRMPTWPVNKVTQSTKGNNFFLENYGLEKLEKNSFKNCNKTYLTFLSSNSPTRDLDKNKIRKLISIQKDLDFLVNFLLEIKIDDKNTINSIISSMLILLKVAENF